uniref:Transcription factor protein n=1 Tax=Phallusia mammillata TaxID=59560 RepID=A0A6F9DE17_9ASCI|nr:transcription factor protein [Phallusia mammillata]
MICIILVAGHGAQLEKDILKSDNPQHLELAGVPKALLAGLSGKKIIDYWWNVVNMRQLFSAVYLVTNADKYKHYERWATANDFPVENIINDGSTTIETSLGSVADFALALQNKQIEDDVLVVAGDMLFEDQNCDISQVVKYFKHKNGELVIYYEMDANEDRSTRGIVEVDLETNRIIKFYEKPEEGKTTSMLASVVFYCFRRDTLSTVNTYLEANVQTNLRSFGKYMEWLINETGATVYGMKLPTRFQLIGQVTLDDYEKWLTYFKQKQSQPFSRKPYTSRAYARVGLIGNPSDGFFGKTISMSITNFWANVTIRESEKLILMPHPLNDPTSFGSMGDLYGISKKEGYLGGLRLLQATCKKFYEYCSEKGIALCKKNFTLSYDTNIPRQVGLAGSSAIVTATLNCLLQFFSLSEIDMPKPIRAKFALSVETDELYINAGLQDRVVQVYEGLVHMDFSRDLLESQGYGKYEYLKFKSLPKFWLAFNSDPSDSGKVHSDVRQRFDAGDKTIADAMKQFSDLTTQAWECVEKDDWVSFAKLMDQNFDLRKNIYGEKCLGQRNLEMIEIARKYSSSGKFPGSGGAVVGICHDEEKKVMLKKELQSKGFVYCDIVPFFP